MDKDKQRELENTVNLAIFAYSSVNTSYKQLLELLLNILVTVVVGPEYRFVSISVLSIGLDEGRTSVVLV